MWLGELLEVFQREQDRENSWHLTIQQTNYNILSSLDISFTMSSMVSVFSPSSSPLHQTGLEVKLAMFYTNVVTPLLTLSHKYVTAQVLTDVEHISL